MGNKFIGISYIFRYLCTIIYWLNFNCLDLFSILAIKLAGNIRRTQLSLQTFQRATEDSLRAMEELELQTLLYLWRDKVGMTIGSLSESENSNLKPYPQLQKKKPKIIVPKFGYWMLPVKFRAHGYQKWRSDCSFPSCDKRTSGFAQYPKWQTSMAHFLLHFLHKLSLVRLEVSPTKYLKTNFCAFLISSRVGPYRYANIIQVQLVS